MYLLYITTIVLILYSVSMVHLRFAYCTVYSIHWTELAKFNFPISPHVCRCGEINFKFLMCIVYKHTHTTQYIFIQNLYCMCPFTSIGEYYHSCNKFCRHETSFLHSFAVVIDCHGCPPWCSATFWVCQFFKFFS